MADPDKSRPHIYVRAQEKAVFCAYFVPTFSLRRSRPNPINTRACGLFQRTKKMYEKTALFCAVFLYQFPASFACFAAVAHFAQRILPYLSFV